MISAQTRVNVAQNKAQASTRESEAELAMSGNLENSRKHVERMKMTANLTNLSAKGKIVISGKNGEQLLSFFKEIGDMVNRTD